ncbi:GspE/PulE family protein [bacterium]|nr:GspE/PulE family protein [bacterium]
MSGTVKMSSSDVATLVAIAVVLGFALVFAVAFTGLPSESYIGHIQRILAHPVSVSILVIFFIATLGGLFAESLKDSKRKNATRERLRDQQEMLIRPVRVHNLFSEISEGKTIRMNEVPGKLAQLSRRSDKGVPALVDAIIGYAIQTRSSDIHVEPSADYASIRFRQDGILSDVGQIPNHLVSRVSSRLRVLANLTIFAKGKPQDGRIEVKWEDNTYDVRLSFLPTLHGDKIVVRLFESGEHNFNIRRLGLSEQLIEIVSDLLLRPQGTVFLTGPTGSGKTTTIYSAIRFLIQHRGERTNIVTIEDPIEKEIMGINQTQVNPKRDLTFASGLRSILRQDPDVIIVGEVRDRETAEICTQAGLTGHLVISTIHAASAVGVFNRLIDMGIEPFLVASSICGILSQRLVKKNCPHCIEPVVPSLKAMKLLGVKPTDSFQFMRGKGCDRCNNRGFYGRIGVFEILLPSQKLKDALQSKVRTSELQRIAREEGMISLHEDGLQKVKEGLVDIEELAQVII